MKRLVAPILSLVVLVAAAVAVLTYITDEHLDTHLIVEEVEGSAKVTSEEEGEWNMKRGKKVRANDIVRTGADGRAVLSFSDDTEIRLGSSTHIAVQKIGQEGVTLELEDGALEATVRKGAGALHVGAGERKVVTLDADFRIGRRGENVVVDVDRGELKVVGAVDVSELSAGSRARVDSTGQGTVVPVPDDLLLLVEWPERRTRQDSVALEGTTEPGARVRIDGGLRTVEVVADADGGFSALVPLQEGTTTLHVGSKDILGTEADAEGTVERDTQGPTFQAGVEYSP